MMGALAAAPAGDEVEREVLGFGEFFLRPLRPDDRIAYYDFLRRLDREDVRLRMGHPVRADRRLCERLLNYDRAREEAFIALAADGAILGVARIVLEPGEIAVIVRSDMKHRGIGEALLGRVVRFGRARGLVELSGYVLHENRPMLDLARKHGCRFVNEPRSSLVELRFLVA
jgi:acetyltransferase